MFKKKMWRI